jgi:methionyl-tRNA formyltransferase
MALVTLRIAYFGLPLAALLLLEDGRRIDIALLSRADAVGGRRLRRMLGPDKVLVRGQLSPEEMTARLRNLAPDLVVSWFWTTKLPITWVELAPRGGLGVHPSLLPRHRGPDPYFAAIDQGDSITGVTVHRIAAEYDTGAILATRSLQISERWNAWQLARRLDRPSLALLRETVAKLAAGDVIPERPQDEAEATWAPMPSLSDCALRWSWSSTRVLRRIRALSPAPGAFTEIRGVILTILEARLAADYPRALAAGEAAVVGGTSVIRTSDGAIALVRGEIEGHILDEGGLASLVAQDGDLVIG